MHHSVLLTISGIALFQTISWIARKKMSLTVNLDRNSMLVAESIIITGILFGYIFLQKSPQMIFKDIKKLKPYDYLNLIIRAICVTGSLVLIFDLIPIVDISKLGPSVSVVRILMLTIVGFFLFNEKMTTKKILAVVLMVMGISLLLFDEKN